jgi:hypothetical protein
MQRVCHSKFTLTIAVSVRRFFEENLKDVLPTPTVTCSQHDNLTSSN